MLQDRYKQRYTYKVDDFNIVNVKTDSILTLNTEYNLLIITCYPFDSINSGTPLRYVVSASHVFDPRAVNY